MHNESRGLHINGTSAGLVAMAALLTPIVFNTALASGQSTDTTVNLASLQRDFQKTLDQLREQHGFPGATAAFILRDGRYGGVATGMADQEAGLPMGPDSRIASGSIGKTFVAAVALTLVEEGTLELDRPIEPWLSDELWFSRLPNGPAITLRMLLNHSGGLSDHVYTPEFAAAASEQLQSQDEDGYLRPRELVRFILDKEPLFAAGKGFHYTDTGYILVGLIIEKASGRKYYDLLGERLLAPLSLNLTTPANRRVIAGLVPGYLQEDNPFGLPPKSMTSGRLVVHPAMEWTGGGLSTNSKDLVRWAKALYEGKVVDPKLVDEMLSSVAKTEGVDTTRRYGLGVRISETPLGTAYGHSGWFPGYNSIVRYFPKPGVAVAIQVNRDFSNPLNEYATALSRTVLEALDPSNR